MLENRITLVKAQIALLLFALLFITLHEIHSVPKWDAGDYYHCIVASSRSWHAMVQANCETHNSVSYLFLLSLPRRLGLPGIEWIHLTNFFLLLLSTFAFREVIRMVLPNTEDSEAWAATALYALAPATIANTFSINLDFGVMCFFVFTLLCLLRHKLIGASACGLALVLTKETGAVLYLLLIGSYVLVFILLTQSSWIEKAKKILSAAVLLLPLIPLSIQLFNVYSATHGHRIWYTDTRLRHLTFRQMALDFNFTERHFTAFLENIFILNFNWLLTAMIAVFVVVTPVKLIMKKSLPSGVLPSRAVLLFLSLLAIGDLYIVTRFRPWCHVRYVLAAFPLLFLFGYISLRQLIGKASLRRAYLGILIICFGLGIFYSPDPLSRLAYGSVTVGNHKMYDMLSVYAGRRAYLDGLIYNLQHTYFDKLAEQAFADLKPNEGTLFMVTPGGNLFWPGPLNRRTYRRTTKVRNSLLLAVTREFAEAKKRRGLNEPFYFLALPAVDNSKPLKRLYASFRLLSRAEYWHSGYMLEVYTFSPEKPS